MSNLIPEKRLDKNGVLTTKHVRAGAKPSAIKSALPAPSLTQPQQASRAYKQPNKTQLKRYSRAFTASVFKRDTELMNKLDIDSTLGVYRFMASDSDLYEMMAFTSTGNALTMQQAGIKTSTDAIAYLRANGMEHLIERNYLALEAQERRIPVEDFMRETMNASEEKLNSPLFLDSIEASGIAALNSYFTWEVREGLISLADIKAVGATRIKKADSWDAICDSLKDIHSGKANYTTEDLKNILDRFSPTTHHIKESLVIADYYGGEFAMNLKFPNTSTMDFHSSLIETDNSKERNASLLAYASVIYSDFPGIIGYSRNYPDGDEITRFHDAGISVSDVVEQKVTVHQLDAIEKHGISASVSGGWL